MLNQEFVPSMDKSKMDSEVGSYDYNIHIQPLSQYEPFYVVLVSDGWIGWINSYHAIIFGNFRSVKGIFWDYVNYYI